MVLAAAFPNLVSAIIDHNGIGDMDLCDEPARKERWEMARSVRELGWPMFVRKMLLDGVGKLTPLQEESMKEDSEMVALHLEEWTLWKEPLSSYNCLKIPVLRLVSEMNDPETVRSIQRSIGTNAEFKLIPGRNQLQLCSNPMGTRLFIWSFLAKVERREEYAGSGREHS
ncbi:MAG: hypothetical protein KIY11_07710 [Thermoplasmata archaeon]|nr:hypothetical protein [Candidatus Sysuiplasma acidicola]